MSMFTSSGSGGLFSSRKEDDDEVSLPLYNPNINRSSGFLAPSTAGQPTSRSSSPRPLEIRIPRPATPIERFAPAVPPFLRRARASWQAIALVILGLYTVFTIFRSPVYKDVESIAAEYDGGAPKTELTHLVVVAAHAIWMGGTTLGADEKEWTLLSYQHGLAKTFKEHIQKGVEVAKAADDTLLVFSGGETRDFAGPSSEGQSYWSLAYLTKWIDPESSIFYRSTTEEFARDSYENLLFSICRFHEYTSNYPSKITVIGFDLKRERFKTAHRHAIRFPDESFNYIGIDPSDDPEQLAKFIEGEKEGPLKQFTDDPHGCVTEELVKKRKGRNPFRIRHGYEVTCPELKGLLRWCTQKDSAKDGKAQLYPGPLPWSNSV